MHSPSHERIRADILDRLNRQDHASKLEPALNLFLDLGLEYDSLRDFKTLCVMVPDTCLHVPTSLYMRGRKGTLLLRRSTAAHAPGTLALPNSLYLDQDAVIRLDDACIFPIRAESEQSLLGALCLHRHLSPREEKFLWEYVRRMSRILNFRQKEVRNRRRLTFINNLMRNIGHNIIVPNMEFKLLFLRMGDKLRELEEHVHSLAPTKSNAPDLSIRRAMPHLLHDLYGQLETISQRFQQSSLFLESLLRREHFEHGRYRPCLRVCRVGEQIFEPQLERYRPSLRDEGIQVVKSPQSSGEAAVEADLGLISQVFANLLGNAVKYTQAVHRADGVWDKSLIYGWESSESALGQERPGVRIFVSSSGEPVPPQDMPHLFDSHFRSTGTKAADGSGYGLFFVKQIVELHKGKVEYSHADRMNTFHIILPSPVPAEENSLCPRQS
jgi:signal transduction histidine kinase